MEELEEVEQQTELLVLADLLLISAEVEVEVDEIDVNDVLPRFIPSVFLMIE